MRKPWMLVSSYPVSTAIVFGGTVFAAVGNTNTNSSQNVSTTVNSSNPSSGMSSMVGSNRFTKKRRMANVMD